MLNAWLLRVFWDLGGTIAFQVIWSFDIPKIHM